MNAPVSHHAILAALRQENDELRETVRQLREDLAPTMAFPPAWRLTPQQATLLSCLMAASPDAASFRRIRAALYQYDEPPDSADDQVSVLIYGIRTRLRAVGIEIDIRSEYGIGYRVPLVARDQLLERLAAPQGIQAIEEAEPAWWATARRMYAAGKSARQIGKTLGKHHTAILRIVNPVFRERRKDRDRERHQRVLAALQATAGKADDAM